MKNKSLVSIIVLICFIVSVTTSPVVLAGKISLKFVTPTNNQVYTVGEKITCSATVSGNNYKHASFYLNNSIITGTASISEISTALTKPVINKPLNGEVINKSNPTFRVSWEAVPGASLYYFSVRKNGAGSTVYPDGNMGTGNTYVDLNTSVLEYGTSYTVFVTAQSSSYVNSDKSDDINFTVAPKVSELNITYPKSNQVCSEAPIHITWSAVTGAEWYNLYFNDNVSSPQIVSNKYTSYDLNFGTGSYKLKIEAIGNTLQVIASGTVPFTVELKNNVKVLVIDKKTGEFISNAEVKLGSSIGNTYYNDVCNFFNLDNGTYDISCSRSGYKSFSGKITVQNGLMEYKIYMESMPEDYSISGKVTDQRGNPISGALVETEGGSVITDFNGYFSLEGLNNGTHYINVQKDGYEPEKDIYTNIDGGSIIQNISLYKYTPTPTMTNTPTNTPTNTSKSTPSPASITNKNDSNPYNGGAINVISSTPTPTPTSTVHVNNPVTPVPAAVIINNPMQNTPTKIELSESYIEINTSQKKTLNAKVSPESALINSSIRWDSDKDYIVSVDNHGNLIARQPGEARITATTVIGGLNASCRVVVMPVNEDEDVVVNPGYVVNYQDIKGHWAEKDITALMAKGLIKGYEDNSIKPDNFITRNEALIIIAKLAKMEPDSNQDIYFKDIDSIPKWVSPYLSIIIKYGIIEGYDDNTFKGNNKLTRAQAATILAKILYQMKQITLPDSSKDFVPRSKVIAFKDFNKSHWANTYLDIAFVNGIMGGYVDGTIRADKNITRAEFFTMCTKLLNLLK